MGIPTEVWRAVRYDGPSGCAHELLLQAGRPSASNADQAAVDAADAFAESSLDHQQSWFERWRLPRLCVDEHVAKVVGRAEESGLVGAAGFRWVAVWRSVDERGWMTLSSEAFAGAELLPSYLVRDAGAEGDLREP